MADNRGSPWWHGTEMPHDLGSQWSARQDLNFNVTNLLSITTSNLGDLLRWKATALNSSA